MYPTLSKVERKVFFKKHQKTIKALIGEGFPVSPPKSDFPSDVLKNVKYNAEPQTSVKLMCLVKYFIKDISVLESNGVTTYLTGTGIDDDEDVIEWSNLDGLVRLFVFALNIDDSGSIALSKNNNIFSIECSILNFSQIKDVKPILHLLTTIEECTVISFHSTSILPTTLETLIKKMSKLEYINFFYDKEDIEIKDDLVGISQVLTENKQNITLCTIETYEFLSYEEVDEMLQNLSFIDKLSINFCFNGVEDTFIESFGQKYGHIYYKILNNDINHFSLSHHQTIENDHSLINDHIKQNILEMAVMV